MNNEINEYIYNYYFYVYILIRSLTITIDKRTKNAFNYLKKRNKNDFFCCIKNLNICTYNCTITLKRRLTKQIWKVWCILRISHPIGGWLKTKKRKIKANLFVFFSFYYSCFSLFSKCSVTLEKYLSMHWKSLSFTYLDFIDFYFKRTYIFVWKAAKKNLSVLIYHTPSMITTIKNPVTRKFRTKTNKYDLQFSINLSRNGVITDSYF